VVYFGWRVDHIRWLVSSCLQNLFSKFLFGGSCNPAAPPPTCCWVCLWFNMMYVQSIKTNNTLITDGQNLRIIAGCCQFMAWRNVMDLLFNFQLTGLDRLSSARYQGFYCNIRNIMIYEFLCPSVTCDLYCSATVRFNVVCCNFIHCAVLSLWICDYVTVFCFVSLSYYDLFHAQLLYGRTLDLGNVYVCVCVCVYVCMYVCMCEMPEEVLSLSLLIASLSTWT
jgi:hypothetical protein